MNVSFLHIAILYFTWDSVEARPQFLRKGQPTNDDSSRNKLCPMLATSTGSSRCGSHEGRGICYFSRIMQITSSNTKLQKYFKSPKNKHRNNGINARILEQGCKCFGNFAGSNCGRCKNGFTGPRCTQPILNGFKIRKTPATHYVPKSTKLRLSKNVQSQIYYKKVSQAATNSISKDGPLSRGKRDLRYSNKLQQKVSTSKEQNRNPSQLSTKEGRRTTWRKLFNRFLELTSDVASHTWHTIKMHRFVFIFTLSVTVICFVSIGISCIYSRQIQQVLIYRKPDECRKMVFSDDSEQLGERYPLINEEKSYCPKSICIK
ncbi:uncharacterized protein LOC120342411 [Styela clava]